MTSGRFCRVVTKKIKAWMTIDNPFGEGGRVGTFDGVRAKQIFESRFMTLECFNTILGRINSWFERLHLAFQAAVPDNGELSAAELQDFTTTNGQMVKENWSRRPSCSHKRTRKSGVGCIRQVVQPVEVDTSPQSIR